MQKFNIFDSIYTDDELETEFTNFFYKYNLTALFTNEHRAQAIKVTYVDAKSVVNPSGKYHKILKQFSSIINIAQDNKMYEDALFEIIYTARTFQGFMNQLKKLFDHVAKVYEHLYNYWNIVFYTEELH